ncbi:MAG: hypothetical protein V2I62_07405 [Bacteroidales bacterium]|jgi:hypothetical protein|nr:hypothetical protein [Bacteroidales bacterium]
MAKKLRIKRCLFCNEEFEYKSIRAKYCSDNCKNNYNRRKYNKRLYDCIYPIHVELAQEEYEYLIEKTDEYDMTPEEFIKWILTDKLIASIASVFLSEREKDNLEILFEKKEVSGSFQIALRDWILETAKNQLGTIYDREKRMRDS